MALTLSAINAHKLSEAPSLSPQKVSKRVTADDLGLEYHDDETGDDTGSQG